jgi:hypothetical protein
MPAACVGVNEGHFTLYHSRELICDPEMGFWSSVVEQVPGVGTQVCLVSFLH